MNRNKDPGNTACGGMHVRTRTSHKPNCEPVSGKIDETQTVNECYGCKALIVPGTTKRLQPEVPKRHLAIALRKTVVREYYSEVCSLMR